VSLAARWGADDVTVSVYRLQGSSPSGQRGYRSYEPPWFGLTADTEDELHSLAEAAPPTWRSLAYNRAASGRSGVPASRVGAAWAG
jgi:hypothetical protein